jgi:hypothetical protein
MSRLLKQKLPRFFALTLALTMMFTLCFATTALANDDPPTSGGPIESPEDLKIKKTLLMPVGTITPDVEFEFEAKKLSLDGDDSAASLAMMPELNIDDNSVPYSSLDTATAENNTISITKSTDDLFDGITFDSAGVYEYEITEKDDTFTSTSKEILTFSKTVYLLQVYVANNANGNGTYIRAISIIDKATGDSIQGENEKVGELAFINTYVKTNAPVDPEKPDPLTESTLEIANNVTGEYGSTEYYFDFTITPEVHELFSELGVVGEYFRAYIVEDDEVVVDDIIPNANGAQIGTDGNGKSYIEISTSGETSFKLKDGQKLVFVDTPAGTSYEAVMTLWGGHDASYTVTANGQLAGSDDAKEGDLTLSTGPQFVGELDNSAVFTNDREGIIPTGISINSLPFIGIILLPVIALALFIALKIRKNRQVAK